MRLVAVDVAFTAELVETSGQTATIALEGTLEQRNLRYLEEEIEEALESGALTLKFDASRLHGLSSEGLRYLTFLKQKHGKDIKLVFVHASPSVAKVIEDSGFAEEVDAAVGAIEQAHPVSKCRRLWQIVRQHPPRNSRVEV